MSELEEFEIENIVVVPSMSAFAEAFDARMTPPYATADADTDAKVSVLNNVRMAWKNQDQIPIPAGTSAEAAVVHVITNAAKDAGVIGRDLTSPFVGSTDAWDLSAALSPTLPSPFHLIEKENDWNLRVFAYDLGELRAALKNSEQTGWVATDRELEEAGLGSNSIVITCRYVDHFQIAR